MGRHALSEKIDIYFINKLFYCQAEFSRMTILKKLVEALGEASIILRNPILASVSLKNCTVCSRLSEARRTPVKDRRTGWPFAPAPVACSEKHSISTN
jgi:hypothetical protein